MSTVSCPQFDREHFDNLITDLHYLESKRAVKRSGEEGGCKEREEESFLGGLEDVFGRERRGGEVEVDAEAAGKLKVRDVDGEECCSVSCLLAA